MSDWINKSAAEILEDLKSMVSKIKAHPLSLEQFDTIGLIMPLDQWERVMWYGWWPEYPPALDLWRITTK